MDKIHIEIPHRDYEKFREDKLRILLCHPWGMNAPFYIQGCKEAFLSLGHTVDTVDSQEWIKFGIKKYAAMLGERIFDFKPDFVFAIDHRGLVGELLTALKMPHASWFLDTSFRELPCELLSPYCCIFVLGKVYVDELRSAGFKNVFHLPIATNERKFQPIDLTKDELKRYGCSINFVGSSCVDSYQKYRHFLKSVDPEKEKLFDEVIKIQIKNPFDDIWKAFERVQSEFGIKISFPNQGEETKIKNLVGAAAAALYRAELVSEVSDLGLHLYGDEGWRDLVGERVKFFGLIHYWEELPKLLSASKITLNITRKFMVDAENERIFNAIGCGSLPLTNRKEDSIALFQKDTDLIYYKNKAELREKAKYYLEHNQEREEIVDEGRKLVLKYHTYRRRMQRLIDIMRALFSNGRRSFM